ncbi:MAG: MerR family transcriptional regulator, partial [Candidatus Eremiobacteraeota bacterium]|nr:MerR family transcriptional regulator [Candidatus Eremiobacteraeota bacterium]
NMSQANREAYSLEELRSRVHRALEKNRIGWPVGPVSTETTARNIRYYIQLGLMDRPLAFHDHQPVFGQRHAYQLLAIRALQARSMSLPRIQKILFGLNPKDLEAIIRLVAVAQQSGRRPRGRQEGLPSLRHPLFSDDRATFMGWLKLSDAQGLAGAFPLPSKN